MAVFRVGKSTRSGSQSLSLTISSCSFSLRATSSCLGRGIFSDSVISAKSTMQAQSTLPGYTGSYWEQGSTGKLRRFRTEGHALETMAHEFKLPGTIFKVFWCPGHRCVGHDTPIPHPAHSYSTNNDSPPATLPLPRSTHF